MYKKLIELKRLFEENNIDEEFAETLFILCGGKKFYDIGLVLLNCIKKGTFDFDDYVSTSKYLFMVAPLKEKNWKEFRGRLKKHEYTELLILGLPTYLKMWIDDTRTDTKETDLQYSKNRLRLASLKLFKI